jgi:hypothetical protein
MTANGYHHDPIDLAADAEAATVCMLVNGQRHRLSDVVRERHAALLRRSGARAVVDDGGVVPSVLVTWPQPVEEGAPVGGCGPALLLLWKAAVFMAGLAVRWFG